MKLELKHLAPYLPYKLKILEPHTSNVRVMNLGKGRSSYWVGVNPVLRNQEESEERYTIYKPILRPLSDLSSLGEENIPINEHTINLEIEEKFKVEYGFFNYYKNELSIHLDGDPDMRYDANKSFNFEVVEYIRTELLRGYYDVFGLIEKGLAININDIK